MRFLYFIEIKYQNNTDATDLIFANNLKDLYFKARVKHNKSVRYIKASGRWSNTGGKNMRTIMGVNTK